MNDSKISQTPPNTEAHTTPMQRALVEAKADMRIRSKNKTAAEWAEEKGHSAITKFLNDTIQSQSAEKDKKDQSNPVEKVGSKGE